jgi:aldehyde:ferredoxin oxidoreductase
MVTARGATADTLVKQSRQEQLVMMAIDSVGVCQFTNALPDDMGLFVSDRFDVDWDGAAVLTMARAGIDAELEFNRRAGFDKQDDRLPKWMLEEPMPLPDGPSVFDVSEEMIDAVWGTSPEF